MLGSITLISYHEQRRDDLYNHLFELIGDRFYIKSLAYYQLEPGQNYSDDLVVITAPFVKDTIISCLSPDTPYIIANRTIKMERINLLLDIPAGCHVLVVYNLLAGSIALVNDLKEMGFTDFFMHSYDNNSPLDQDYNYAITLGEPQLVPPGIPNIIDLGMRNLNLSTIGSILAHFTGRYSVDEFILKRYIKPYVNTYIKLYKETKRTHQLKKLMEALIADIEDGVILFDKSLNIILYNDQAYNLLNKNIDNKQLRALLPEKFDWENRTVNFTQINYCSYNIIIKPISSVEDTMMLTIKDVKSYINVKHSKNYTMQPQVKHTFKDIIHCSTKMINLILKSTRMAQSNSPIMIYGESGTGKELLAHAIHNASPRYKQPFLAFNCGALNASLLESELFGYEEGAFTGAKKKGKQGLFETAEQGTLFLDEIGDASLSVQQKLLRVLQEKEVLRVSGTKPIPVDVRIIVATHQNLPQLIKEGRFREDLYYRINVLPIQLPPLRERPEDIQLIFYTLLDKLLTCYNCESPSFSNNIIQQLKTYHWPGNIRQLSNLVEFLANGIVFDYNFNAEAELEQWLAINKIATPIIDNWNSNFLPTVKKAVSLPILNQDTQVILESLEALKLDGQPPNRKKIQDFCHTKGFKLSDSQIKHRIKRLQELKLAQSRKGYGTQLTELGLEYLQDIH